MRFSQRSSLRGRRYLPRGATPGSATAASVSGQSQNLLLQVGFLSFDKNVGLKLRVSPLISQTCYRAFQMQFSAGHCCPAKLYHSGNYTPERLLGFGHTSFRCGCNSPFPTVVSPVLLQSEPGFLACVACRRFRATQVALPSPTTFGPESDGSRVGSWSSFIFQLPIGIPASRNGLLG